MKELIYEPKIAVADIETGPNLGTFWRAGNKINISYENIEQERTLLCVAWKILGEDQVYYTDALRWKPNPNPKSIFRWIMDDEQICKDIQKGWKDIDTVIAHNGKRFDIPWINGRMMYHRMPRINPDRIIDTLQVAKDLNLNSKRLDYLSKFLGYEGKIETKFSWWTDIIVRKDKSKFKKMVDYNIEDVVQLENVYNDLMPYTNRPLIDNELKDIKNDPCPFCGSKVRQMRGWHNNKKTRRRKMQCECGEWLKGPLERKQ